MKAQYALQDYNNRLISSTDDQEGFSLATIPEPYRKIIVNALLFGLKPEGKTPVQPKLPAAPQIDHPGEVGLLYGTQKLMDFAQSYGDVCFAIGQGFPAPEESPT